MPRQVAAPAASLSTVGADTIRPHGMHRKMQKANVERFVFPYSHWLLQYFSRYCTGGKVAARAVDCTIKN